MYFKDDITYYRSMMSQTHSLLCFHIPWTTLSLIWGSLLLMTPAGCSEDVLSKGTADIVETPIGFSSYGEPSSQESTLDILTFEDDRLRRLNSYMRIRQMEGETIFAESTSGNKIFFLCSGGKRDRYDWAEINSYSALRKLRCELENETRSELTMTGECRMTAGSEGGTVKLTPLVCAVSIESLNFDFSGTAYAGSSVTDVCAYLTNINGTCGMTEDSGSTPERIINYGMLICSDLEKFREPDLIFQNISDCMSSETIMPGIVFHCYSNPGNRDIIGRPRTRLVIEGKVDGMTYYWPITVNPDDQEDKAGIHRGYSYRYDIVIRRKGVTEPDSPIDITKADFNLEVLPWIEKKDYGIRF